VDQYCAKCRTLIRAGAQRCANCGEIAGDLFDGRIRKPERRRSRGGFLSVLMVLLALSGAYWWWTEQQKKDAVREEALSLVLPSTRVVGDRPGGSRRGEGAKISEAEAMRILRRHFAEKGTSADCLFLSSQGYRDGAYQLTARDHCQDVRLGRWAVDGDGKVRRGE
jgi:hypothetical protein